MKRKVNKKAELKLKIDKTIAVLIVGLAMLGSSIIIMSLIHFIVKVL